MAEMPPSPEVLPDAASNAPTIPTSPVVSTDSGTNTGKRPPMPAGLREVIIAVVVAGILFVLLAGLVLINSALSGGSSSSATLRVNTQPTETTLSAYTAALNATETAIAQPATPVPTLTPSTVAATSTPAPTSGPVSGPYLGAPLGDWDSAFGAEASQGSWNTTIAGQQLLLSADTNASTGGNITTPDGQDRVWNISISFTGANPPSDAEALAVVAQLLPTDARHMSDDASYNPVEHIYSSQQLAHSLDANAFQNNAGASVPPGTFSFSCQGRGCVIMTGQN